MLDSIVAPVEFGNPKPGGPQIIAFSGASSVLVPGLNPMHLYWIGIRGGNNNNASGLWYFQTSADPGGASPHGGASDYAFLTDQLDSVDDILNTVRTTGNGSAGFQQTTGALLNGVLMGMLFDAATGDYVGQGKNNLASSGQVNKFEFAGSITPTNAQSLIFFVSAGTFSGKVYVSDLG